MVLKGSCTRVVQQAHQRELVGEVTILGHARRRYVVGRQGLVNPIARAGRIPVMPDNVVHETSQPK